MFIVVVWLIYYFIPNAQVRLRDVWVGAVLAGLLWRLAFAGFAWYMATSPGSRVHGSVTAVVVFLVWVYMSAVILLYGAEVSAAYAHLLEEAHARGAGARLRRGLRLVAQVRCPQVLVASMRVLMKNGRSSVLRAVMRLPSRTTGRST